MSQNCFDKPVRRLETVGKLKALYVDIDCYKLDNWPEWTAANVLLMADDGEIPKPNMFLYTTLSDSLLAACHFTLQATLKKFSSAEVGFWQ